VNKSTAVQYRMSAKAVQMISAALRMRARTEKKSWMTGAVSLVSETISNSNNENSERGLTRTTSPIRNWRHLRASLKQPYMEKGISQRQTRQTRSKAHFYLSGLQRNSCGGTGHRAYV